MTANFANGHEKKAAKRESNRGTDLELRKGEYQKRPFQHLDK